MFRHYPSLFVACGLLGIHSLAKADSETPRFIPATPENTHLADGSPLPADLASCGWKWLPGEGNDGVFASIADADHSTLMVGVDGLDAGAAYEVFGYFWADGFDGTEMSMRNVLPAQFGCTLAELQTYDGPTPLTDDKVGSWMVAPGIQTGADYGYFAVIEKEHRLDGLENPLKVENGEARLVRARLGLSRADASGKLPVFFAGYPYAKSCVGRSRIDGVAVRRVEHDGRLEMGWKAGTRLHLAIRAGDPVTVRRELEAGADMNAFDEERLTPLFYACGAEDLGLVQKLLDNGADPNLKGQSVLPLAAAAMTANEELVKLLLKAGAKVPMELAKDSGELANAMHPAWLHPVIVAIRSGSVPVLELLLEHAPALKLSELHPVDTHSGAVPDPQPPSTHFVVDAMRGQQWEMAEFLLNHGREPREIRTNDMDLFVLAIRAGDTGQRVLDALIRLGNKPVNTDYHGIWAYQGPSALTDGFWGVEITDMLMAAVDLGHADLTRRFLATAGNPPLTYQESLLAHALFTGNQEIIGMIREKFPRAAPARWQPGKGEASDPAPAEKTMRLFLPRTRPPERANAGKVGGQRVMAVISSPEAEGPAAALAALASATDGWMVVERDLIETALAEGNMAKPWQQGEHRMADLGDRISADSIIIASKTQGEKSGVLAFEVVEVATGLVVHREHFNDKELKIEEDFAGLLERARLAMDAAGSSDRHEAVTLLAFTGHGGLPNESGLARQLHVAVQREVDGSPGMISLTRAQSGRLVEEQALQGNNQIWGAAHMVEGSVSRAEVGKVKVVLRLETFGAGGSAKRDAEVTGPIHELPDLASRAWRILFEGRANEGKSDARDPAQARKDGLKEAARLLREAEWLTQAVPDAEGILPMVETAVALGAPVEDALPIHLDVLFRRIGSVSRRPYSKPYTFDARNFMAQSGSYCALRIDVADRLAHDLPKVRELLHNVAFHLEQNGKQILKNESDRKGNAWKSHRSVWESLQVLLFVRAVLNPNLMEPAQREEYASFAHELDDMVRRYFALRRSLGLPLNNRHRIEQNATLILNRNPAFKEAYLQMFGDMFPEIVSLLPRWHTGTTDWLGVRQQMLKYMERMPESQRPGDERFFLALVRCMAGDGRTGREASDAVVSQALEMLVGGGFDDPKFPREADERIARHSMSDWFGMNGPRHGAGLIPALVHNPRLAPDFRMRWRPYLQMAAVRNAIPRGNEALKKRLGINDYFSSYERTAKSQREKQDIVGLLKTRDGARLLELLGGYRCHVSLNPLWEKEVEKKTAELEATLMAAWSEGISNNPGVIFWSLADSAKPDILWFLYYAFAMESFEGRACANSLGGQYEGAWLIALDCRSGKALHRINLKQAVVGGLGQPLDIHNMLGQGSAAIAQTEGHIMLNVSGLDPAAFTVALVIDKTSGKARALPPGVIIGDRGYRAGSMNYGRPVIGHRGDFYFLDDATKQPGGIHRLSSETYQRSLFRINPVTMKLSTLVEYGRRPAMTPFDDIDRPPGYLSEDMGRLAVYNEKTYAYYDPVANTWDIKKDHTTKYSWLLKDREERVALEPINQIRIDGKSSGWQVNWIKPQPGQLQFDGAGKLSTQLTVLTGIPEEYRKNTWFKVTKRDKGKPVGEAAVPFEEHIKDIGGLFPYVVHQSEDHLILALQDGRNRDWEAPVRNSKHQPFLFKLRKDKLLESLENQNP